MKKIKKLIGILLVAVMLIASLSACGTTKLAVPGEEEKISVEKKKPEQKKEDKQEEKKEKLETEEYLDVESAEDKEVDYSKYEEKKSSDSKEIKNESESENGSLSDEEIVVDTSDERRPNQDKYLTDPVPEGKPKPVEPGSVDVDTGAEGTCYLRISCATILDAMEDLTPGKEVLVPSDGIILSERAVTFYEGESVFDVLQRETQNNRIHMESSFTPKYNSAYVEGINNLYEFDCGKYSGWMYEVNGWYPNYGCSRYQVQEGDVIHWNFTCDLGRDLGQTWVE